MRYFLALLLLLTTANAQPIVRQKPVICQPMTTALPFIAQLKKVGQGVTQAPDGTALIIEVFHDEFLQFYVFESNIDTQGMRSNNICLVVKPEYFKWDKEAIESLDNELSGRRV